MNYKESAKILEEIKKAKKILINCHRGPDPDSIGSALALSYVLESFGKEIAIICPSEKLYEDTSFLKNFDKIKKDVDFSTFDYSSYDLFFTLDSSSWEMVSSSKEIPVANIPIMVIDHHHTNSRFGKINLVDEKASSVGEVLYLVFKDWKVKIDTDVATALLTGIIGDTGIFKYPNTTPKVFEIAYKLMKNGAKREEIIANIYRNYDFNLIKFCGEALVRTQLDLEHQFIYSAIPFEIYEKLGKPSNGKEIAADLFTQITKGTEFGFMAVETEKNKLSISFRSRNDFDTSLIATALGGGGHLAASGAKIEGLSFEEAVQKVLVISRKYTSKR